MDKDAYPLGVVYAACCASLRRAYMRLGTDEKGDTVVSMLAVEGSAGGLRGVKKEFLSALARYARGFGLPPGDGDGAGETRSLVLLAEEGSYGADPLHASGAGPAVSPRPDPERAGGDRREVPTDAQIEGLLDYALRESVSEDSAGGPLPWNALARKVVD